MRLSQAQRAVIIGALAIVAVLVVVFAVIIIAVPTPGQVENGTSASQATATPRRPTVTPTPTTPPATAAQLMAICGFAQQSVQQVVQVGDLAFAQLTLGPLTYPGTMLPDGWSTSQPHQTTTSGIGPMTGTPANPANSEAGMLSWSVCNVSATHAHLLQQVALRVVAVTPDTSQPDIFKPCDVAFNSQTRQGGDLGCGGSMAGGPDIFQATWPAQVTNGTTVTMPETATASTIVGIRPMYGAFPVTLKPHTAITIGIMMTTPPPGLYTFVPGVAIDHHAAPVFPTNASAPVFLAGNAHFWGGQGCMQSKAMQAQIPKSGPVTYWVCPEQSGF